MLLFYPQTGPLHSFVKEQICAGGECLLKTCFPHWIIRHPEPLGAKRRCSTVSGRAATVSDKMSRMHVAMMNQDGCQAEEVIWGARVRRKRVCSCMKYTEIHYIPRKACLHVSTCSHKWGWVVSSILVSVERWMERFHWTMAYCCYSVLNLQKKLTFILRQIHIHRSKWQHHITAGKWVHISYRHH